MVQASQVLQDAAQRQQSVYDQAEATAQLFVGNAGQLYPVDEAIQTILDSADVAIDDPRLAARTISHLVEDVADPMTAAPTDAGLYVGVIDYTAQDFYYESTQFHDIHGESVKAVCAQCVDDATFDHQAVTYPSREQYRRQVATDHAFEGVGSVPHGSTAQERRTALGAHFLDSHASVTAYEVAGASPTPREDVISGMGPSTDVPDQARVNQNYSPGDVLKQSGVTFDHVKQSFDLGIDQITVGATLVSGTTIGGNTALHGGNQIDFNVEAFGTASATSGDVPTAQGDGTLAMQTPSGGSSAWTLDGTFSPGSTSDATYTMSSNYPIIEIVVTDDSSATANNEIDLRVNGNSTATYHTSQGSATPSADNFAKEIFHTTYAGGMKIMMAGQWSGNWSGKTMGGENPSHGNTAHEMASTGLTSPLDSFTIFDDAAGNYNITADVYGYTG